MSEQAETLALTIDTAASTGSIALFEGHRLVSALTWRSLQNQSRELLPGLDWLLGRAGREKEEIGAIFVCIGPGSYAGLRVGLSTAKALAFGLGCQIAGVGRLEADALPFLDLGRRVLAVHAAGRAELAWAAYRGAGEAPLEDIAPTLGPSDTLTGLVAAGDVVCGDLASFPEGLAASLAKRGANPVAAVTARYEAVTRLGWRRLAEGRADNLDDLVPMYLRAPAIGPQPPR